MSKILTRILCASTIFVLSSCVVEQTPYSYRASMGYYRYNSGQYFYRKASIVPVAHGFDPDPQYVNGYVFRGRDGMLYSAEF